MGRWTRRVFDLLVIVGLACGLLSLAWQLAVHRQPLAVPRSAADSVLPDTPELQLLLPLERSGMVLSRESVPGGSQLAIEHLERKCREVFAESDSWVLSLAVSDEERRLLEQINGVSPISCDSNPGSAETRLYPLTHPTGRMGIRVSVPHVAQVKQFTTEARRHGERQVSGESAWSAEPFQRRNTTRDESAPLFAMRAVRHSLEPRTALRSQFFSVPPCLRGKSRLDGQPTWRLHALGILEPAGPGAAPGGRLLCWGFILSEGTESQTVWFARPREKLPPSAPREGPAP